MKFYFFVLILVVTFGIEYSKTRTIKYELTSAIQDLNTTTSWWTRTYPIIANNTVAPRSRSQLETTTLPLRISRAVRLTVPVAIFGVTLLFGFALIIFAIVTHGNGVSFLTRTNEHRLV